MVTRGIKETRNKEQQPDKMEKVKRLEKEKKAMQRKEEDLSRGSKQQVSKSVAKPQKRSNHKDWTRVYEEGLYEEDDINYTY